MSTLRSFATQAVVLKRSNVGESDRVVTLLTAQKGKLVAIAKGVRKLNSSKRAYLEPGNLVKAFFVNTKSLPLLTQAELLDDFPQSKQNLVRIRQLSQVLEIVDKLFVEEEIEDILFKKVTATLKLLCRPTVSNRKVKQNLQFLISQLGYADSEPVISAPDRNTSKLNEAVTTRLAQPSILSLVEQIAEKPMRSWEYLKVGN